MALPPQPMQTAFAQGNGSLDGVRDDGLSLPGSKPTRAKRPPRQRDPIAWRIREIGWVFVIRSQLWATALLTIVPTVLLGVIHWAIHPRLRPFAIYDGTLAYPDKGDTIPPWVATVVPFLLMLISLYIGEFVLFKQVHKNITMAVSTALHFLIDVFLAFLVTQFMSELTKHVCGVLRPDFLARAECGPPAGTQLGSQPLSIGWSAMESLQQYPCRANAATQRSSRQAFVSGHAATATCFSFYSCGYFLWCMFYRDRRSVMSNVVRREGKAGVFLKDLGQSLAFYWVLAQICLGWGIGISRIIDYKHGTADVVGGFVLGQLFGLAFVMKAIPTAKYVVGRGPEFNMAHSFDHRHGFIERIGSVATSRGLDQYDSMVPDRRPAPDQEAPAASTAAVEGA